MSIFGRIKEAIFGKPAQAATPPADSPAIPMEQAATPAAAEPIDIVANLSALAEGKDLNWRGSIVDLMKLVGIDASYDNRKELAQELGNADYSGSAEDNIMLHKQLMKALAENGGRVPAELLD